MGKIVIFPHKEIGQKHSKANSRYGVFLCEEITCTLLNLFYDRGDDDRISETV